MCLCDISKVLTKMGTTNNVRVSTGSRSGRHTIVQQHHHHPQLLCSSNATVAALVVALIFAVGNLQTGKLNILRL